VIDELGSPPNRPFRLHAVGGLANRLRAILSYRAVYRELQVVWKADEYVSHGRWAEVFEPVEGITFIGPERGWDAEAFSPHKESPDGWEEAYREVRVVPGVAQIIGEEERGRGAFVAVHIRRTDMIPLLEKENIGLEPLSAWLTWAKQWPALPVYVATDNGVTQETMRELLGPRAWVLRPLKGEAYQELTEHRRNGTLVDAVVDLIMCSQALHFRGSVFSSFSETITTLRRLNARHHP